MAHDRQTDRIDICDRSLSAAARRIRLQRRRRKDLAFYLVILLDSFCLFSFAGPSEPKPEGGLFLRSPTPVLPDSVMLRLKQGETDLSIAMSFDGYGNVREAHVVKSSGVPAADEAVRKWIESRWKARPEVARKGFYKGKPLNSTEFTLPMALIRR